MKLSTTLLSRASTCCALLGLIALGGCTVMTSSQLDMADQDATCNSGLGSYVLTKTLLKTVITQNTNGIFAEVTPEYVPDNNEHYCLNFLASATSDDKIQVKRFDNGSLEKVASDADEQSAIIIRKIIRGVFFFIANRASVRTIEQDDKSVTLSTLTFDPFDAEELAAINSKLNDFGFCVVLEDYGFDRNVVPTDAYCADPIHVASSSPSTIGSIVHHQVEYAGHASPGVKYRPLMNYTVEIWRKPDPTGPDKWELASSKLVPFPNISPVLNVRVNRALFAKRKTALLFDETGSLNTVCIRKTSEALEAVKIPIEIAKGIAELPLKTFEAEISRNNGLNDLYVAQKNVIVAQQQLINLKRAQGAATGSTSKPTPVNPRLATPDDTPSKSDYNPNLNIDDCSTVLSIAENLVK